MEITALYGPSGTGKSTSALSFAYVKGISTIIDDGLLIHQGRKAAGYSAKYEKNYISAVKRAIFFHDEHLREVQEAIHLLVIDKIMIIGTSKRMVDKIADRLQLGKITHYYTVEDVRTSKEIKMALYNRKTQEKHVIPLPYEEIEHGIFKRLIQRGKKILFHKKNFIGETTIVQPNFQNGMIHIDEEVFKQIIAKSCSFIPAVEKCHQVYVNLEHLPYIRLTISIFYDPTKHLMETVHAVQSRVSKDLVEYLNIEPDSIDVLVSSLVLKRKSEK